MATSPPTQCCEPPHSVYSNLEGDHDSRLLYLESLDHDETLHCSLKPVNIHDLATKEGFYALSYCWGTESAAQTIYVNGLPFAVRPNLLAALLAIYSICGPVRSGKGLWVDALCINQNDNDDKSRQVQGMGDIYREANGLIIWLGEADKASSRLMPSLQLAGLCDLASASATNATPPELQAGYAPKIESLRRTTADRGVTSVAVDSMQLAFSLLAKYRQTEKRSALIQRFQAEIPRLSPNNTTWSDLICFLDRQWFFRIWTFQEVMCHEHRENTLVLCGTDQLDYRILETVLGLVTLGSIVLDRLTGLDGDAYQQDVIAKMSLTMNLTQSRSGQSGMDLLDSMRSRHATDARDYVYGILSLVPSDMKARIPVDYAIPAPTLYARTLSVLCATPQDLTLLLRWWAEPWIWMNVSTSRTGDNLPSWCPDFSRRAYASIENSLLGLTSLSSGTMTRLASRRPTHSFSYDGSELQLDGIYLDTIIEATTIASYPSVPDLDVNAPLAAQIRTMIPNNGLLGWLASFLKVWHHALMTMTGKDIRWKAWEKQFFCPWNPEEEDDDDLSVPKALQELIHFELRHMMAGANVTDLMQPVSMDWLYILGNVHKVANICKWRYFFFTKGGYIGAAPVPVNAGDHVYCFGGEFLEVVSNDRSRLIGPASVEGLMGDALVAREDEWEVICLS